MQLVLLGGIGASSINSSPTDMNYHPPVTRRKFFRSVAATTALFALPGCCSVRRSGMPQPIIPPDGLFIDPHCHIFNGRDLDIYNYVAGGVPWYAYVSLPVLYSLTELIRSLAPTHEEELRELNKWLDKSKVWLKSSAAPAELGRANELLAIETTKFVDKLEYEKAVERDRVINAPSPEEAFERARIKISQAWKAGGVHIDSVEAQERQRRVFEHLPEAIEKLKTKPGVLAFFDCFFHYRTVNAARLQKAYPMMSLFTPAMMDTDSWFQHRRLKPMDASTPLAPQIEIYEKIAIVTNARFLPIFAFDPRRQVEWEKNPDASAPPFALVKECLKRTCFVGLKLYPPMGYRPANNAERDATPSKDWWKGLGHSMDAVLRSTFTICSKSDLPVMAHANRSNGSEKQYNDDSAPEFWRMALKDSPDLKVNLGHFGGLDNKSGWRSGFCDLMTDYRGVYADTGDFIELSGGKKREKFIKDLAWRSEHTAAPVLSRLMYGSDFFMNGLAPDYKQYAEEWIYSFQKAFPKEWPQLVGGNAADYLGLRGGLQRQRLGEFITRNGLTPEWAVRTT